MTQRRTPHRGPGFHARDRGAVAVEFALLLPILLLLLVGIVDFGRLYNAQVTLTQAAREGARLEALDQSAVTNRTRDAAFGLTNVTATVVTACASGAGPTADAQVNVAYTFAFNPVLDRMIDLVDGEALGASIDLEATGVMPCET